MCYIRGPISHEECINYVWQTCTKKVQNNKDIHKTLLIFYYIYHNLKIMVENQYSLLASNNWRPKYYTDQLNHDSGIYF